METLKMAEKQWTSLGDSYESKHVTKSDGTQTFMTRMSGQTSEYPHTTEFVDPTGVSQDHHYSGSNSDHNHDVVVNASFWLQDDVYETLTSDSSSSGSNDSSK
jgi:hypothetical protein